jgi:hypothetical protein
MRALFKKAPAAKGPVDINLIIQEVLTLTQPELQKNRVSLRTQFAVDLPIVLGDKIQLIPREDLRLIAETVKRFLDSKGDRSVIEDRESLIAAVDRVKAHSDRRPDRIDRRAINQRLEQYARGERKWLFCDSNRVMKFLIHLVTESEVGQHVQEIACLERKEHRLEEVGLALREAKKLLGAIQGSSQNLF